jgi:hypothetical protein
MNPWKKALPNRSHQALAMACLLALSIGWMGLFSDAGLVAQEKDKAATPTAQMLFVQTAQSASLDKGKLILKGINPLTVFFSDRPTRVAGHLTTDEFMPLWTEGKDSFTKDPPNATLSIFGQGEVSNVVMVLRNPQFKGDELSYDVRVIQGKDAIKGGPGSLFIDVIGMPLTPVSYAGAARRAVVYR